MARFERALGGAKHSNCDVRLINRELYLAAVGLQNTAAAPRGRARNVCDALPALRGRGLRPSPAAVKL
jgi:hypothetical protein